MTRSRSEAGAEAGAVEDEEVHLAIDRRLEQSVSARLSDISLVYS
jgi:hypothetical protein